MKNLFNLKTSAQIAIFSSLLILLWTTGLVHAYEEPDSLTDSLRTVDEILINGEQIRISYSDGSDSVITRPAGDLDGHQSPGKGSIIKIGAEEVVRASDSIRGDILVIAGDLQVAGYVKGNIAVTFGNVIIAPTGSVEGEINCLWGQVVLSENSHVWGDINAFDLVTPVDQSLYDFKGEFNRLDWDIRNSEIFGPPGLVATVAILLFVSVIVVIITAILPRPVARVRYHIETGFIRCFLVGLLLAIAIFPLWIMIFVTFVGIPFAILVYPFALVGAFVLGAIGFTQFTGFELGRRTTLRYRGYMRTTFAGILTIASPLILATFFGFINIPSVSWALFLVLLGIQTIMFITGLGAVFFSRFGTAPERVDLDPEYRPD